MTGSSTPGLFPAGSGEGAEYQPAHLLRPDASLDCALVARKHALERCLVLHEALCGRLVADGAQGAHVAGGGIGAHAPAVKPAFVAAHGIGIQRGERHVPAAVEADERAHRRAVVLGSGGAYATGRRIDKLRKQGRGALPFYFLYLLSFPCLFC